jgi:hypothetical protein
VLVREEKKLLTVLFPDGRAFTLKVISNITPNESNGIMVEM